MLVIKVYNFGAMFFYFFSLAHLKIPLIFTLVIPLFYLSLPYSVQKVYEKSWCLAHCTTVVTHELPIFAICIQILLHESEWLSPVLRAVRGVSCGTDWGHFCYTTLGPQKAYKIEGKVEKYKFGAMLELPKFSFKHVCHNVYHLALLHAPYVHNFLDCTNINFDLVRPVSRDRNMRHLPIVHVGKFG